MSKKNQRKKAVVNAQVQWTLALRVVLHFFVFVCAGAIFGLINQFLSDPFGGVSKNLSTFWQHSGPMLLALLCLMPVFIRDTLTLSNRMAGPICRLRDSIKRISEGEDVPPLKFRRKDMWDDVPALFNAMVERLRAEQRMSSGEPLPEDLADDIIRSVREQSQEPAVSA